VSEVCQLEDYELFIQRFKIRSRIDLGQYNEAQMKRRLTALCDKKGYSTFASYMQAMDKSTSLYEEFLDRITINVSEFFRNPIRCQQLEQEILPVLESRAHGRIRTWSAACSSGEEPYSLAMILSERLDSSAFTIQATDLDELVLEEAKVGRYGASALNVVVEARKKQYFIEQEQTFEVVPEIKRLVRFSKHDLLRDRYVTGFDLIICRNVLSYFTEEAKAHVYRSFVEALKPGGILFVGGTEQIFQPERFGLKTKQSFFYEKIG
jgi:chemotaxis protein methyltransferase CheR